MFNRSEVMKRNIYTLEQVRRIKKIDNVVFEGQIIKEIVDELYRLRKEVQK